MTAKPSGSFLGGSVGLTEGCWRCQNCHVPTYARHSHLRMETEYCSARNVRRFFPPLTALVSELEAHVCTKLFLFSYISTHKFCGLGSFFTPTTDQDTLECKSFSKFCTPPECSEFLPCLLFKLNALYSRNRIWHWFLQV